MSQSRNDSAKVAGATYTRAGQGYFEKRTLKRSAGIWGLWGLAVAAVISGDFSGWNFGIDFAGFGGMLIAFVILVAMYYGMIFSIGEMAAAMPHTGGAYSFARSAMGPWGGLVTGARRDDRVRRDHRGDRVLLGVVRGRDHERAAELLDAHVGVVDHPLRRLHRAERRGRCDLVQVRDRRVDHLDRHHPGLLGDGAVLRSSSAGTSLWDIVPDPGQSAFLPHGVLPILFALPFAMWFFLGIEELPLAAEESHDPERDIPRAGFWARGHAHRHRPARAVPQHRSHRRRGHGSLRQSRCWTASARSSAMSSPPCSRCSPSIGLLASLQGIMFAYGRNMYSLSRAGYYPKFLSLTGKRQTPWVALAVGAVIGFIALVLLDTSPLKRSLAASPARSC